jgi:hypothetical protein
MSAFNLTAATIVFVREAHGQLGSYLALAGAIVLVHLVLLVSLRFAGLAIRVLREAGSRCWPRSPVCCWRRSPCSWSPTRCAASSWRLNGRGG